MKIELQKITIRELTDGYIDGYQDGGENGIVGYGGKLDIRPPYQREFIYKDKQREAVITTVKQGFPLNVMYWAKREDNDAIPYEIIDGQQRTISICQYVNGDFSHDLFYFNNLTKEEQDKILDYELMIYICSGTDREKLQWFKTINIAGEQLTEQELRNAVYAGSWVTDAKRYFSKTGCAAYRIANRYLLGTCIRQDYLQTAIGWITDTSIEQYMAQHQHDQNANQLWLYFKSVIEWIVSTFVKYRKEMKGVNWGDLYNNYHTEFFDTAKLEKDINRLMSDSDVTNKKGIYQYVFDHKEKNLNIRTFDDNTKRSVYEKQLGVCPICGEYFDISQMEADHIVAWSKGGRTTQDNCQMLCKECNLKKSNK